MRVHFNANRSGAWILAGLLAGCGGATTGGTLKAPAAGFSMKVPARWALSKRNHDTCFHGYGTGVVLVEPLGAGGFGAYVDAVSRENGAQTLSRSTLEVDGHRAIELVSSFPDQRMKGLAWFIDLGDRGVNVSFTMPEDEFTAQEGAIRNAMESASFH